jgi:hypothetical protein
MRGKDAELFPTPPPGLTMYTLDELISVLAVLVKALGGHVSVTLKEGDRLRRGCHFEMTKPDSNTGLIELRLRTRTNAVQRITGPGRRPKPKNP